MLRNFSYFKNSFWHVVLFASKWLYLLHVFYLFGKHSIPFLLLSHFMLAVIICFPQFITVPPHLLKYTFLYYCCGVLLSTLPAEFPVCFVNDASYVYGSYRSCFPCAQSAFFCFLDFNFSKIHQDDVIALFSCSTQHVLWQRFRTTLTSPSVFVKTHQPKQLLNYKGERNHARAYKNKRICQI